MGDAERAITVIVADDEPHVVDYLELVLTAEGFEFLGGARDADGAAELALRYQPDVVLLDLRMPGGGADSVQLIGSLSPGTRIVIFSAESETVDVMALLRSGIDGYVMKGCTPERLAEAIHHAMAGDTYLVPQVNRVAVGELTSRLRHEHTEQRQLQRLRAQIGRIITTGDFTIVAQPIVDLRTRAVPMVEVLARFPTMPNRLPEECFDDAERVGLRVALELATNAAALSRLRHGDLRGDLAVAVNASPSTILSGRLSEALFGVPPARLVLELTENEPVRDYRALKRMLEPWRSRGMRLAVDDAGSGYSSFAHILELHPEFIKLAHSLSDHIHLDPHQRALARAIIEFATELDAQVIAEGVETADQLDTLVSLGTHLAQGFHLGRPVPIDDQPILLDVPLDELAEHQLPGPRT